MKSLTKHLIVICWFVLLINDNQVFAGQRRLAPGHWLTCWGGNNLVLRKDPIFHKNSPEEEVKKYIPSYTGSYQYEVKDTWQEWVTRYGTSCLNCGESCSGSGSNRSCSCNSCSWQELETFYRPWSTQQINWQIQWTQSKEYREKRKKWLDEGSPELVRDINEIDKLKDFDPERPLEYFLFPGEVEKINVYNYISYSATEFTPSVAFQNPYHDYKILVKIDGQSNQSLECTAQDHTLNAVIKTGQRLIVEPPNSIEFRKGWAKSQENKSGELTEEPGQFELFDISAQRYEAQNVFDHYKNTKVSMRLREIDRAWWFDRFISAELRIQDNRSILKKSESNESNVSNDTTLTSDEPMDGVYEVSASDLFRTPLFKSQFHLHPGKNYEICTWMRRENNIYYKQKKFWYFDVWSEANCAMFKYNPPEGYDLRSTGRKFRDAVTRFTLFPWW